MAWLHSCCCDTRLVCKDASFHFTKWFNSCSLLGVNEDLGLALRLCRTVGLAGRCR